MSLGPLAIKSVTTGGTTRIVLAEPAPAMPQGALVVTGTDIEGAPAPSGSRGPPLDGTYSIVTWLSPTEILVQCASQGTWGGKGTVTIRKPYTAAITAVSSGPGSTVSAPGHSFATGDEVTIQGTGVAGVDSPQSGAWTLAAIASISPGPNSIITFAQPTTIPPGTSIAVADGSIPVITYTGTFPDLVPTGPQIVSATAGPNARVTLSEAPGTAGMQLGDQVVIVGTNVPGLDSPIVDGVAVPWTVTSGGAGLTFTIQNGTSAAYVGGGLAIVQMADVNGLYQAGQFTQLDPLHVQLANGATVGASHAGAEATWFAPLVIAPYEITVTGPDTFTIRNGPTSGSYSGSGGIASDVGPP